MKKTVIELFAGVGGFRVGLNNVKLNKNETIENGNWDFVWANQWEPSTKIQHAFDCYEYRFGKSEKHSNVDISLVNKNDIPDHNLLCGGFPCQDYSVARSLSNEQGIEGKKGVLWWQIRDILVAKKTPFVFLENVDRLLKSPAKQRGRDFGIMLRCLAELGYVVEWRVINAAEYGLPQRRRRIYIFAYKNETKFAQRMLIKEPKVVLTRYGIFASAFKVQKEELVINSIDILNNYKDLIEVSNNFKFEFQNAGVMMNGVVYTTKTTPIYENPITLGDIKESNVDNHYYLNENQKKKFEYLRGHKTLKRISKDGHEYNYSEGAMSPYDSLDLPGRTMLTSEGSINRSTHIILDPDKDDLRLLTPVECERLNQFPDDWTNSGMLENRRYFMMGNALVCGIVSRLGKVIERIFENEGK